MAILLHFPDSRMKKEDYATVVRLLEERGHGSPDGREHHVAVTQPDGAIQVFDIWDTEENQNKFKGNLMPILEEIGASEDSGEPVIYPIHNTIAVGAGFHIRPK